jgi:hypothetical protein
MSNASLQLAALRAIHKHYEHEGQIPTEDQVAEWIGVRPSEAIDVIDGLAAADHVELMDVSRTQGFGSRHERAVYRVTRRGEDYLADAS